MQNYFRDPPVRECRRVAAMLVLTPLLVTVPLGCSSLTDKETTQTNNPTTQEIAGLFTEWRETLATGDPEIVASRYAPNAVLLPTASNQVRYDHTAIVDYFTSFLAKKPSVDIIESTIDILDSNTAIDTGVYRFNLAPDDAPVDVTARYTYVYERIDDQWLIVNHHSSALPEG